VAGASEGPLALPPQFFRRIYLFLLTILVGVYAVVVTVAPTPWVDLPLGLLTLLFVPGYAIGALAFGARPRWPWSLTFAIVVGFSVAFNVAVGLALLGLHRGLPAPAFAFVDLILLMVTTLVWVATQPVETGSHFSTYLGQQVRLPGLTAGQRALSYALLVGIVLALVLIVYFASIFPPTPSDVTLGLVGSNGSTSSLISNGTVAVTNATGASPVYVIEILIGNSNTAQAVTLSFNAAINNLSVPFTDVNWSNTARSVNLTGPSHASLPINLTASESFVQKIHFYFSTPGRWLLQFLLSNSTGQTLRTAAWSMNIAP
jgi:uncharacterized membrane protein